MSSSYSLRQSVVGMILIAGCGGSTSTSTPAAPATPPEYTALFDTLPAATPDKLRGVWSLDQSNPNGPAELRFRFSDNSMLVGVRCMYTSRPGLDPVIAGQTETATITGLDAATGTFTFGDSISISARPDVRVCEGQFTQDNYNFTIKDNVLSLSVADKSGTLVLNKVGD